MKAIAIADLVFGVLLAAAPWLALPARVPLVDGTATALGLLHVVAGVGLLRARPWAPRLARSAALLLLCLGVMCLVGLAISASFLSGAYGTLGKNGATILGVAIIALLPYLVGFPILVLVVLRATRRGERPAPERRGARRSRR